MSAHPDLRAATVQVLDLKARTQVRELRAAVRVLLELVEEDRAALYESITLDGAAHTIAPLDRAALDYFDGAIQQAKAALGQAR